MVCRVVVVVIIDSEKQKDSQRQGVMCIMCMVWGCYCDSVVMVQYEWLLVS